MSRINQLDSVTTSQHWITFIARAGDSVAIVDLWDDGLMEAYALTWAGRVGWDIDSVDLAGILSPLTDEEYAALGFPDA